VKEYSKEFQELISDPLRFEKMMEQNYSAGSYEDWEHKRKFIAKAINDNGTILDIGCASGFFLRSMQEWAGYGLVPYGIDINGDFIEEAKRLFPQQEEHFVKLDVKDIVNLPSLGFPNRYDYVYLSVPGDIADAKWRTLIKTTIIPMANKRFIIGFYGSNKFPFESEEWEKEREQIKERIEEFKKTDLGISGSVFNPTKFNQAIAWIDR